MQNNNVNKGTFYFLGTRIWAAMPVYRYENLAGYITDVIINSTNLHRNIGFENNSDNY